MRENQHLPVADIKWEHHLTVAGARHFGNVSSDRVMQGRTVHSLVFLAGELMEADFPQLPNLLCVFTDTTSRNLMGIKSKLKSLGPLEAAASTHLSMSRRSHTGSTTVPGMKLGTKETLCKCV